jgi:hypothetical protein
MFERCAVIHKSIRGTDVPFLFLPSCCRARKGRRRWSGLGQGQMEAAMPIAAPKVAVDLNARFT